MDMTYLRYFIDLTTVHEWNWGAAILSWIISYFHRIHSYFHRIRSYDPDPLYIDAMPRAARYILHRGNQKVGPYRVYLDRTAHDDIRWTLFSDYADVVPFGRIALYSGWLAYGANTMISPFEATADTVTLRDLTAIFQDWAHHMVPDEYRSMRATQRWHCVDGYVTWFYQV
ncbi:uncharacterized protein LOC131630722 [Vicia villosa]|uniref:uncharacterized protein LOC131630722 n=1 Tax=Vicia villosa TaxID=3911 RepID=UPI00273C8922|nr:uncharacterized protein LOC131630722 [Vicia villosa]